MRVERPEQPEKEAAGSRHELGAVRQAVTADVDPIDPPTENLMEEVLRRENLLAALKGGSKPTRGRRASTVMPSTSCRTTCGRLGPRSESSC